MEKTETIDIASLMIQRSRVVDEAIKRYLPRFFTDENMYALFGPPRFSYHRKSAEHALSKPAWELLGRGGKRWRSVFFLLICEFLGNAPEGYEDFSALIELLHNGSLIADDIEDDSGLRRGLPALHKVFGLDIACNAASALYFFPLNILLDNRMGLDDSTRLRIYEIYSREMINIHLGQGMDIVWQSGKADMQAIGELDYMQMGALKTGTLPRLAARLGAALCKADKAVEIHLAEFAESLGIGFQIYDDVLNLTCSNGKNQFTSEYLGSDISEGKISLIIIHAIKQGIRIKRLQEIISLHTRDKSLIDEAIAILRRNGSIEYAAARSKSIIHEGWNKLHAFFHDCGDIRMLDEFVEFINRRDH